MTTQVYRILVGNQVGVGLTPSTVSHMLPSLFPAKEASKQRPHASEAMAKTVDYVLDGHP